MSIRSRQMPLLLTVCVVALGGCGGGGSRPQPLPAPTPSPTPAPAPTPTPVPTPSPSPTPTPTGFDDSEYRRSSAAVAAKALGAYNAGATGAGVKIGIVDSGINPNLSEFAGRIDPASQNLREGGAVTATDFHGTAVAAIAAAARNGAGLLGVAFNATIIALNSADPTDCDGDDGCSHDDPDIAHGVDVARTSGARVINISLGGSAPAMVLAQAIDRATRAGIVIVISAGNDGDAEPDPLGLQAAQQSGHGLVVIAGSVTSAGAISTFSNKAGSGSAYYLTALGSDVRTIDETGQAILGDGTSFSAPVISGAVALVASAFPNMTGAQIVDLLFRTADDLGASGVDSTYGHGELNLTRAFQPQGQTSLAGSVVPVALGDVGQASAAMGDAKGSQSFGAVILDGYSRAFAAEFAGRLAQAARERPLAQSLAGNTRTAASATGPVAVSLTVRRNLFGETETSLGQSALSYQDAGRAKALAGYALGRVDARTAVAFGFSESGRGLQQRLSGQEGNAFLVARDPLARSGFISTGGSSIAVRRALGGFGLTVTGENGQVWQPDDRRGLDRPRYSIAAIAADRRIGPALLSVSASRLEEAETVLGGRLGSAFTSAGGTSWFVDGSADLDLGSGWGASASYRRGWTSIGGTGALVSDGRLATDAWALDLSKALAGGDRLAFRVTQPLRVSSGGLNLNVPVSYDYADGSVGYEARPFNLAPTGREVDFEAAYSTGLWGGAIGLNSFLRRQPGHIADAGDDIGAAVRYSLAF